MLSFEQFVEGTAARGGSIKTIFEERLFALVGTLERVAGPLATEGIPYELVGGGAVMVQMMRVEPSAVRNTKDIDIMIRRQDLARVKVVMARHGFGIVRVVFSGERVDASQVIPNPFVRPEHLSVHGVNVAVIPVADLVAMKLSNNRDIDRVHVRDMDSVWVGDSSG